MLKKKMYPMFAVAALGLAGSFNGCSCNAEMGTPPKVAEPPPPPPPVPPPAPAPEPAPVVAAPPPKVDVTKLKTVGKAKIEGDQIKIPGKLEFDVDKATIRNDAGSTEILTTLAEVLKQNPNVGKVRIEGHTDNSGSSEHNHKLSKDRADAVAKYLTDHGVDKTRLETVGHGEDKGIVPNDTPTNKQINRRTEFHILEIDGKPVDPAKLAAAVTPGVNLNVPMPAASATPKPGETVTKQPLNLPAKGGGK